MFTFAVRNVSSTIQTREIWTVATTKYHAYQTAWTELDMTAWVDTFFVYDGSAVTGAAVLPASLAQPETVMPALYFYLPRDLGSVWAPKTSDGSPKGFAAANGRNWYEDPRWSITAAINFFGSEPISHAHLWYLGE
jgi:hypothetical protein